MATVCELSKYWEGEENWCYDCSYYQWALRACEGAKGPVFLILLVYKEVADDQLQRAGINERSFVDDVLEKFEKAGAADERSEILIKNAAAQLYGGASRLHRESQLWSTDHFSAGAETVSRI